MPLRSRQFESNRDTQTLNSLNLQSLAGLRSGTFWPADSAIVGTFGKMLERRAEVTPNARTRPSASGGSEEPTVATAD